VNLFTRFASLTRPAPVRVATVTAANGSAWFVQELDGSLSSAIGQANVGDKVFLREGHIIGPAPDLPVYFIEE